MKTTLINNLATGIVRWRWSVVIAFAALLALALTGVGKFKIAASADTLLVKDNKLYIQTQVAQQTFNPDEFILLAYEPLEHDVFSDQTFNDLSRLQQEIKQIPRVESVTSILTVPLIDSADALSGQTKVSELTWQQQRYSSVRMKELVSGHPIFTDLLINRDNTATSIQIVFKPDPELVEIEQQITAIQAHLLNRELSEDEQAQLEAL